MSQPSYVELVNVVRRTYDVLRPERRLLERGDGPDGAVLREPNDLVALSVELADVCQRIGSTPVALDEPPEPDRGDSLDGHCLCHDAAVCPDAIDTDPQAWDDR